jgi:hypothetical protein
LIELASIKKNSNNKAPPPKKKPIDPRDETAYVIQELGEGKIAQCGSNDRKA